MKSIRHPRRRLSVTLGPQSQADAYETLAYREKRRRESQSETEIIAPRSLNRSDENGNLSPTYFSLNKAGEDATFIPMSARLPTPARSEVDLYQKMMGADIAVESPLTPVSNSDVIVNSTRSSSQDRRMYEREEREMLSTLKKPRVRYDVEVVTKLIVYMGMNPRESYLTSRR